MESAEKVVSLSRNTHIQIPKNMKAYSLLYLLLFSFAALSACKPSAAAQAKKIKEMEKKELKMLKEAKPEISESEGDTIEDYYGTSREGLINWVLTDTATLSYPFTRSIEKNYVTIATSDDNLLRIYSWNTGLGGTMIRWDNLVQYRSGTEIKAVHQSLDMLLHPDGEHDEIDFGSYIDTIYTYPSTDGSKLYMVDDYFRISSNYSANSLVAMRIKDGNLVSAPCFVRHGKRSDTIGFEHSIADWYFLANLGEGWDWLFQYDEKTQNLYVATTDSINSLIDRYDIYHFNGTDFVYQKTDAPFWLHPQLHNYERLALFFRTKDYMIRIDNLGGETMRYASWKKGKQMSDKPDLVLTGKFIEKDGSFIFSEGSYRYLVVPDTYKYMLKVQHNGKTILQQPQEAEE